jgi:hypothetical protein
VPTEDLLILTAAKKPYKWIGKELESLDPYTDYEKIFRLFASYGGTTSSTT